jgi:hypothetical protein
MKKLLSILSVFSTVLISVSCANDAEPSAPGTLEFHFDNIVGDADLQLNTSNTPYTNAKGEAFKLTRVKYYVSSIKLKTSDGTVYADPVESDGSAGYYLIDEADPESQEIELEDVPAGDYTEVTFTIGGDTNLINMGITTGPLATTNGLFWDWTFGYIFMSLEGVSPASTQTGNIFKYHIGGYTADAGSATQANNIKTVTLSFNGDTAPVKAGHEPEVHLYFDVKKFFNGAGSSVTFTSNAIRDTPKSGVDVAGNVVGAFSIGHVHAN